MDETNNSEVTLISSLSCVSTLPLVNILRRVEMEEADAGTEMEAGWGENRRTGSFRIRWSWLL